VSLSLTVITPSLIQWHHHWQLQQSHNTVTVTLSLTVITPSLIQWHHHWQLQQSHNTVTVTLSLTVTAKSLSLSLTLKKEGNGDLQTLICVLVARPRRCLTLSNPVPWQNWIAGYLGYTLQMKTLLHGWPVMAHEMHTRRRRLTLSKFSQCHVDCTTN